MEDAPLPAPGVRVRISGLSGNHRLMRGEAGLVRFLDELAFDPIPRKTADVKKPPKQPGAFFE